MSDWNLPILGSLYTNFMPQLMARDVDAMRWGDGVTITNPAAGFKRWNSTNYKFEKYNGAAWEDLSNQFVLGGLTINSDGTATVTAPGGSDNTSKVVTSAWVTAKGYATAADPTLTGTVTVPTQASTDSSTKAASTAHVLARLQRYGWGTLTSQVCSDVNSLTLEGGLLQLVPGTTNNPGSYGTLLTLPRAASDNTFGQLALFTDGTMRFRYNSNGSYSAWSTAAKLASPDFTGNPTAPTQAQGDNSTRLANTAHVYAGYVSKTSGTGAAQMPVGTTGQRPADGTGQLRYNTTLSQFEGFGAGGWGKVGGGATGGGSDDIFVENGQTITADYTITAGKNAQTAGPVTINSGVTVTIPSGSVWTIV